MPQRAEYLLVSYLVGLIYHAEPFIVSAPRTMRVKLRPNGRRQPFVAVRVPDSWQDFLAIARERMEGGKLAAGLRVFLADGAEIFRLGDLDQDDVLAISFDGADFKAPNDSVTPSPPPPPPRLPMLPPLPAQPPRLPPTQPPSKPPCVPPYPPPSPAPPICPPAPPATPPMRPLLPVTPPSTPLLKVTPPSRPSPPVRSSAPPLSLALFGLPDRATTPQNHTTWSVSNASSVASWTNLSVGIAVAPVAAASGPPLLLLILLLVAGSAAVHCLARAQGREQKTADDDFDEFEMRMRVAEDVDSPGTNPFPLSVDLHSRQREQRRTWPSEAERKASYLIKHVRALLFTARTSHGELRRPTAS